MECPRFIRFPVVPPHLMTKKLQASLISHPLYYFWHTVLPKTGLRKHGWNANEQRYATVSEKVSFVNEAFGMLLLENGFRFWIHTFLTDLIDPEVETAVIKTKRGKIQEFDKVMDLLKSNEVFSTTGKSAREYLEETLSTKPKWTHQLRGQQGSKSLKYGGWNPDGLYAFKHYNQYLATEREKPSNRVQEETFRELATAEKYLLAEIKQSKGKFVVCKVPVHMIVAVK